jgi:hypothetical protein
VGWTRWTLTGSEIVLSRSTYGRQTWSEPIEIDRHPGLPRDDNGAAEGFAGAVRINFFSRRFESESSETSSQHIIHILRPMSRSMTRPQS